MVTNPAEHQERGELQRRRAIYEALVVALDRSGEVLGAVAASEDADEAVRALMVLLQVDEVAATAVLDMQWGVMTRARRRRIVTARDQLG